MGLFDIFKAPELRAEIGRLKFELEQAKAELECYKSNSSQSEMELTRSESRLKQSDALLEHYKTKFKQTNAELGQYKFDLKQSVADLNHFKTVSKDLQEENSVLQKKLSELDTINYFEIKDKITELNQQYSEEKLNYEKLLENIDGLQEKEVRLINSIRTQNNKLSRSKELLKSIDYSINQYLNYEPSQDILRLPESELSELEEICPSIILKLHCMDIKDLRKAYRENDKEVNLLLKKYSARYTTKSNQAIYKLMVIALRAELQNILYNLKYEKLDKSVDAVKDVTQKYLKIAGEGNQTIAGTLTKFIGEIEYLFINAVKIEYNYYVKKEQARQEQLAIREQMRQEAQERKALEEERKKVEKEESKYNTEIERLKEQLNSAKEEEINKLNARIIELQAQLSDVIVKKEEISNLANGKAGSVYIISNLGSFGENVFKIGMTRRLKAEERVNELGNASVPFKFDIHCCIFSDDAVSLEKKLHTILDKKRVNKVNRRKEFFYTSVDELEELVSQIDPTAEFTKTMLAEDFRQSLSSDENYSSDYRIDEEDELSQSKVS